MVPTRSAAEIARLDEVQSALALSEVAPEHRAFGGGGVAGRGEAGCWVNRVENLGMAGAVTREDVAAIIAWFAERDLDAAVKLCTYADESARRLTAEAGFVVKGFEHVFARGLGGDEPWPEWPSGVTARVLDRADRAGHTELARVINGVFSGAEASDTPRGRADLEASVRCMARARAVTIGVYAGDRCVGGAGFERLEDVVRFYGAAVDPAFRGRGVQQALIAARLSLAAKSGARLATIASAPGGPTERNALRQGFALAYARVALIRSR